MAKTSSRYTYAAFADEVIILAADALTGGIIDAAASTRIIEKAEALRQTQAKKAEYNANNPKKAAPKGPGEATRAVMEAITPILPTDAANAVTTADINAALGTKYTPLNIANAVKFVPGWQKCPVVRDVVSPKGLKSQKEYTGYWVNPDA